jgi:mevalonate kinase
MSNISGATLVLWRAFVEGNSEVALQTIQHLCGAYRILGTLSKTPLMTAELEYLCNVPGSTDTAAKPSGAGGGDYAIALSYGDTAAQRVLKHWGKDARLVHPVRH